MAINTQLSRLFNLSTVPANPYSVSGSIPLQSPWKVISRTSGQERLDRWVLSGTSDGPTRLVFASRALAIVLNSPYKHIHDSVGLYTYSVSQLIGQGGTSGLYNTYDPLAVAAPDIESVDAALPETFQTYVNCTDTRTRFCLAVLILIGVA